MDTAPKARNRRRPVGALLVVAVSSLLAACQPILLPDGSRLGPPPPRPGNVGMNVGWVSDNSTELPFVDLVKMARPWTSNRVGMPWGQGGPLALDADGWVTSLGADQFATMLMLNTGGRYPAGRYTLLYDGTGTIQIDSRAAQVVSQAPGRWEVDLDPARGGTAGLMLHLRTTDPADPVRNIRLIMPGYEKTYATQPFNPRFLQRMQPFDTVRFAWWARRGGNGNGPGGIASWSDRPRPTYAFQTDRGVALEYQIQLVNTLQVDGWFHIPHDATDDYLVNMATLLRDRLGPGRKAYLEYSNETWNAGGPQAQWVIDRGLELGLSTDPFQAGLRYHAVRAGQAFQIFEQVFGGRDRFVRVLAAQSANPWTGRQVVEQAQGSASADVIAIAPYFSCVRQTLIQPDGLQQVLAMTDDEVLDACLAEVQGHITQQLEQYRDLAQQWGLELVAYEGGQHIIGVNPAQQADAGLTAKIASVNRNPRMADIYREYLARWRSVGGGQYVGFVSCAPYNGIFGGFGSLEYQDQDPATAPKYQVMVQAAAGSI